MSVLRKSDPVVRELLDALADLTKRLAAVERAVKSKDKS